MDRTFIDIALRGKQYTVQNEYLARDLSTNGCYPKAWKRTADGFELLKDGGDDAVDRELLASRICRCFDVDQVLYEESTFDDERVTVSKNFTSSDYSIAAMDGFLRMTTGNGSLTRHSDGKHSACAKLLMCLIGESMCSVTRLRRTAITKELM